EEDGTLRVYSDNVDAVMLISGYETSTENTEKMISDIKSGKTMSAGIYERKGSDPEYSIYFLSSSDGTGYLTLDRANEQRRGEAGVLFKIAGWFTVFWIFLMAVYIIAGRHPEKLGPTAFKILYGRFSLRPRE
ncbi:MAG: hypothetical protein IJR90_04735, partial [Clostridia bacterium]|nr:hypothetical protein [Clostridia bacterium]